MRIADVSPDVIGLTEVKPKNPRYLLQLAEIVIDGYDCWHAIDSVGRGVALYTRTSLAATSVAPLPGRSYDDAVWCEIRLHKGDKMIVGCIYRSPNSTRDNNKLLLDMLQKVNDGSYSHVIIMGDFNYPEINWSQECSNVGANHEATKFLEGVRDAYMYQHVKQPTHQRGDQQRNTLDLVLSNELDMVDELNYGPPIGKSHHAGLTWRIRCYCEVKVDRKEIIQYHKGDYEGLNRYIDQQDWATLLDRKTVAEQWESFNDVMTSGINTFIPQRTTDYSKPSKKKPLWMNERALTKVKKKSEAYKRYIETREGQDYMTYCKARNQARRATGSESLRERSGEMCENEPEEILQQPNESTGRHLWNYTLPTGEPSATRRRQLH